MTWFRTRMLSQNSDWRCRPRISVNLYPVALSKVHDPPQNAKMRASFRSIPQVCPRLRFHLLIYNNPYLPRGILPSRFQFRWIEIGCDVQRMKVWHVDAATKERMMLFLFRVLSNLFVTKSNQTINIQVLLVNLCLPWWIFQMFDYWMEDV